MPPRDDETIARTPVAGCPSCELKTRHTEETWKNHPEHRQGHADWFKRHSPDPPAEIVEKVKALSKNLPQK